MANVNYYLDKPFDKEISKEKLNDILKNNQNKNYPVEILNPQPSAIYLYFTFGKGKRLKFNTGLKAKASDWDFKQGLYKSKFQGSSEGNNYLNHINISVVEGFLNLKRIKNSFTELDIKKIISNIIDGNIENKNDDLNFKKAKNEFFIKKALVLKSGTLKEYKTVLKSLDDYEISRNCVLNFNSFEQQFYDDFENFLIKKSNPTHSERGLLNDTISKYTSTLKAFLQWAYENNYHENRNAFENIKTQIKKKSKNEIVVLTKEEFELLLNVDLTDKPYLDRVRDLFCFGCYTGQRFSDIMNFSKHDFDGEKWSFVSAKNRKIVDIPFVGFIKNALPILEKYNYKLPSISNQKFNDYLKEVGEIAGINSKVKIVRYTGVETIEIVQEKYLFMASHMARRTFVTFLLNNNTPLTIVKELTKHSDIRTLMKYESTTYENVKNALEK